jgi:hypothetical protein
MLEQRGSSHGGQAHQGNSWGSVLHCSSKCVTPGAQAQDKSKRTRRFLRPVISTYPIKKMAWPKHTHLVALIWCLEGKGGSGGFILTSQEKNLRSLSINIIKSKSEERNRDISLASTANKFLSNFSHRMISRLRLNADLGRPWGR